MIPLESLTMVHLESCFQRNFCIQKLVEFEKLGDDSRLLWRDFQSYLATEREKVLTEILQALESATSTEYSFDNHSRIVGIKYSSDPLNAKGSILAPPGGRFNFGQSISYSAYFPALYIADSFDTAYAEKFNFARGQVTKEGLTPEEMSLSHPSSFSFHRLKGTIKKVIDIRLDAPIDAFFESISGIKMPYGYRERAKALGLSMDVVNSSKWLRDAIYDPNYQQWDYWIDQPSPSQWFGHYVRLAGIQGMIYNSVREKSGTNIAIFPENFESTESYLELVDETSTIPDERKRIDSSNYTKFY